jgi:TatA/E family protein of Tat protein translocase
MPLGIQPIHIVIIIVVAFLIFGGNKLPELGRSAGKAINEFRKGAKEMTEGFHGEINQPGITPTADHMIQPTTAFIPMAQTIGTPLGSAPAQTSFAAPTGSFCTQCSSPNVPEARFCSKCGTKLPETTT